MSDDFMKRRTPFDFEVNGIKKDPTKAYRWVTKNRIEERKNTDGYQPVKALPGHNTSDGYFHAKGMTLMERPKELEERSTKYKEHLTRTRSQATRSMLDNEAERLSSKHGRNLHKHFSAEDGDD